MIKGFSRAERNWERSKDRLKKPTRDLEWQKEDFAIVGLFISFRDPIFRLEATKKINFQ
jgi:hypothetical protein